MPVKRKVSFCIAISEEILGDGAAVPLQGDFSKTFALASDLGFDSVELHIRNPASYDPVRLKALCSKHHLRIAALGTGLEYGLNKNCLTSSDPSVRREMSSRLKTYIDLAAAFDAVVFIGLLRGKAPTNAEVPAYLDLFARELVEIASYAADKKVRLGLEPIVFYMTNLINTTDEGIEFIKRPGLESIEFLLDTHHMYIEDSDMIESFRRTAGKIAHIHMSDSNRRYPKGGNVDYEAVGGVLKDIGYDGSVSLEIVPFPDGVQAAKNGISWMKSVWG